MNEVPPVADHLARRYGAVTAAEVAALDAAALALGVDMLSLMEAAGIQVARQAWRMLGGTAAGVHVVAGSGHNGGDGLVAARHLSSWGCAVSAAVISSPDRLDGLMQRQCAAARGAGVTVEVGDDRWLGDEDAALVIDALLGTGLRQPPRSPVAEVIASLRGRILSIDVPSGLDATAGTVATVAVRAECTVTLGACKRGFWFAPAREFTGELYVADIGMPRAAWAHCALRQPSATRGGTLRRVPASG